MAKHKRKSKDVVRINFSAYHGWDTVHKQVMIFPADSPIGVEVDEGIQHLILALWRNGYHTVSSCEDLEDTGRAYVAFATHDEARRFQMATKELASEVLRIEPEDLIDAAPTDPVSLGAVAVTFPAIALAAVTRLFA